MQIIFDREKLLNAVTLLKGITRMKSNLPITHCVKLDVKSKSVVLSATDLEISAITLVSCEAPDGAKSFLLHNGTLAEVLTNMKGTDIVMEVPDIVAYGDSKAVIRKGRVEIGLPLADPDDFPEVKQVGNDGAFTIDAPDFIAAVNRTLYASSNDETRYVLTGLMMQINKGTFHMVGTDGFRIAVSRKNIAEGGTGEPLVVPARAAKLIREIVDEHATIEITLEEKRAQFSTNSITVITRIIAEKYPDYESTFESNKTDGLVILTRTDLLDTLKRMSVLTKKEDFVTLRRSPDGMRLDVETQSGYAKETIECNWRDTTPLALNIRLKFLLDAIEHLVGEDVNIQYPEQYGMIRIDEGDDYTIGIMPLRLDVEPLKEEQSQQGSAEEARRAHTPKVEGSTPSPATKRQYKMKKEGAKS